MLRPPFLSAKGCINNTCTLNSLFDWLLDTFWHCDWSVGSSGTVCDAQVSILAPLRKLTQSVYSAWAVFSICRLWSGFSPCQRPKPTPTELPDTAYESLLRTEFVFLEVVVALRASLSGTFLQTLPQLVTPLKERSLSPRSCPPTLSAPSEMFGCLEDCGNNIASKHALKLEARPPRVKKKKKGGGGGGGKRKKEEEFCFGSTDFGFICAGVSKLGDYKRNAR